MKRIPYGIADFDRVIRQGYYYVDKSKYIKTLEDGNSFVYLCRPRRLGKSLFTNMLRSYYDINKADKFEELFGNLWIGKNPTEDRNKFLVMYFDFSQVIGGNETLEEKFDRYVSTMVGGFVDEYSDYFTESERDLILSETSGHFRLIKTLNVCHRTKYNYRLYLMVDEYDNFTNMILSSDPNSLYKTITHGEGFFRSLFKVFKPNFERIYMTGVSPITFDDLTSGYNIATDLSRKSMWNGAIGFTEEEVREMVRYYCQQGVVDLSEDEIISLIKPWYDGYCFCNRKYGKETVYNANSTLYFLNELVENGCVPDEMLDKNTRTDHTKLRQLVNQGNEESAEFRRGLLQKLVEQKQVTLDIPSSFASEDVPENDYFIALLYFFGVVTYGGEDFGASVLRVSNKTMELQYLDYMNSEIKKAALNVDHIELMRLLRDMAQGYDWKPLVQFVSNVWRKACTVRSFMRGERDFQSFFHGMICLNRYYNIRPEMEMNGGFSDLCLFPEPTASVKPLASYIIELKYIKNEDYKETKDGKKCAALQNKIDEAKAQLDRYAEDANVRALCCGTPLKLIYIVMKGADLMEMEEYKVIK